MKIVQNYAINFKRLVAATRTIRHIVAKTRQELGPRIQELWEKPRRPAWNTFWEECISWPLLHMETDNWEKWKLLQDRQSCTTLLNLVNCCTGCLYSGWYVFVFMTYCNFCRAKIRTMTVTMAWRGIKSFPIFCFSFSLNIFIFIFGLE